MSIGVVGEEPEAVQFAADVLSRTGVFQTVHIGKDSPGDLAVVIKRTGHSIRCGTPQMWTWYTLGLISTGNTYYSHLEMEFFANGSANPLLIQSAYAASTLHGLWALPLRASKHWVKPKWNEDPANFAAKLREDLLSHESELLELRPATQPNYGINATVRPVTPLAQDASVAPVRPARYALR